MTIKIVFWGVRGSIPCPGSQTVKYGGNTACIELCLDELDCSLIIDAGSGIREMGYQLVKREDKNLDIKIFLTHTHLDHISGLPFFLPAYMPDRKIKIYGPVSHDQATLEHIVGGLMDYRYFPIRRDELAAEIEYISLKEEHLNLGAGLSLTTKLLNHPILCLGYRFAYQDKIVCTTYDTEPFRNLFNLDSQDSNYDEGLVRDGEETARELNAQLEEFYRGADLLIHDCQYTKAEYESGKQGWGHSWFEYVCSAAARAGVKKLALFHHDPTRTDVQLEELEKIHCSPNRYGRIEIFCAREGMEVVL